MKLKAVLGNRKLLIGIALVLVLVGGVIGWQVTHQPTNQKATITTAQVEKTTLVTSVTSAGQVAATNSQAVTTNVSGVVTHVYVQNGQSVKAGAKLAELDLSLEAQQSYTQALASYQAAKNSLASAQANLYSLQASMFGKWDSFKTLTESDTYQDTTSANRNLPEFHIAEKEWLAAEAQYRNQQAVVTQAKTALNSASQTLRLTSPIIYAPISGEVTGLSLLPGTVISAQSGNSDTTAQTIAQIVTDAQPTVTVNLTETDITKVELNDKVTITIDALPNKTYTGRVISLDKVGSISSGVTSYTAVIAFDIAAPEVLPNMSAQASIITDTRPDVLVVPSSAIQTQNGQSTVQVQTNGQTQVVSVETGLSSGTQIEIISGLKEGDTVIVGTTSTNTQKTNQTTSPFSGLSGPGMMTGGTVRISR